MLHRAAKVLGDPMYMVPVWWILISATLSALVYRPFKNLFMRWGEKVPRTHAWFTVLFFQPGHRVRDATNFEILLHYHPGLNLDSWIVRKTLIGCSVLFVCILAFGLFFTFRSILNKVPSEFIHFDLLVIIPFSILLPFVILATVAYFVYYKRIVSEMEAELEIRKKLPEIEMVHRYDLIYLILTIILAQFSLNVFLVIMGIAIGLSTPITFWALLASSSHIPLPLRILTYALWAILICGSIGSILIILAIFRFHFFVLNIFRRFSNTKLAKIIFHQFIRLRASISVRVTDRIEQYFFTFLILIFVLLLSIFLYKALNEAIQLLRWAFYKIMK